MGESPIDQRRKIIAIAEDDPDDRVLITEAFSECSPELNLEFFDSGPDLLDYLNKRGGYSSVTTSPSLIITTLDIPGKSGFDVILEIKNNALLKRTPLIVMTDSMFEEDLGTCYELGANTVITKPSNYTDLVKLMRSVCDFWFKVAGR